MNDDSQPGHAQADAPPAEDETALFATLEQQP